ncbi:winged helix-turn-helix transcriptional regulator [Candidatus Micrarchaeota archaeon]|nr:winged helix-turn-helix transcriptional regulator [Candidatus Micrarchaeota archaeon]
MNMNELYSTPERERILRYLLYSQGEKTMREIAKEANVSPAQVHKYLGILEEAGVAKGTMLLENPKVHAIRLTQNLERLEKANLVGTLRKKIPGVKGAGIFGSWANGTNQKDSDIDVWVKVKQEPEVLKAAGARKELEKKLGAGVDLVFLDEKRVKGHMEKNPVFYFSLHYSIVLWGEGV